MKEVRNYRMFKKRFPEMDLYQEYRRSHERVKVMLKEEDEAKPSENLKSIPSAQDNLRNFIKQHETPLKTTIEEPFSSENTLEEQSFIRLDQDTIVQPFNDPPIQQVEDYSFQSNNNIPIDYNTNDFSIQPNSSHAYESTVYQSLPHPNQGNVAQTNKIEDELESIIRDALTTIQPMNNHKVEDIDPELLNMMKELLMKNNSINTTNTNYANSISPESDYQEKNHSNIQNSSNTRYNKADNQNVSKQVGQNIYPTNESKAEIFERQIQNQQVPPKPPTSRSIVKRPSDVRSINTFDISETRFSTSEYDDDSSLALTKKEIKLQVKNLIKESLAENSAESPKPNDLLQLEKQLKEHIEKIKQSRKE